MGLASELLVEIARQGDGDLLCGFFLHDGLIMAAHREILMKVV